MPNQKRIFKSKPRAIIMDLDGVLVDSSERFKRLDLDAFENRDKLTYMKSVKDYSKDCVGDIVIPDGFNLLKSLVELSPNIFFVTARGETG